MHSTVMLSCLGMCVFCIHTKFWLPCSSSSWIITTKPKAKEKMLLSHHVVRIHSVKWNTWTEVIVFEAVITIHHLRILYYTRCGNKETRLLLLLISGHVDDEEEGRALTRGLPSTVTQRFIHAHWLVWPWPLLEADRVSQLRRNNAEC